MKLIARLTSCCKKREKEQRIAKHCSPWPHTFCYVHLYIVDWAMSQKMSISLYDSIHMQEQHLLDTWQGRAGGQNLPNMKAKMFSDWYPVCYINNALACFNAMPEPICSGPSLSLAALQTLQHVCACALKTRLTCFMEAKGDSVSHPRDTRA